MEKLIGLTVVLALAISLLVPQLEALTNSTDAPASTQTPPAPDQTAEAQAGSAPASGYRAEIAADARGHFLVSAEISGHPLTLLADTGASAVALRQSDARALGVAPLPGAPTVPVDTANGRVEASPVRLDEIRVDGVVVRDVDAIVLPDAALGVNLLGMTFFKRLARFEVSDGHMQLEQ